MKVKICGIRREEDVICMNEHLPDYIGFIFYPPSRRYIDFKKAKKLREKLDNRITPVGVFVDEEPETILEGFESGIYDMVQLHGNESALLVSYLQAHDVPVIKAFRVRNEKSFEKVGEYDADYFLFDVYSQKGIGGTGESFDWNLLENYSHETPYFLAGGIDADNIDFLPDIDCYGVDISSGAETGGVKDDEKVELIVKKIRKI